jgi:hypothetical protein
MIFIKFFIKRIIFLVIQFSLRHNFNQVILKIKIFQLLVHIIFPKLIIEFYFDFY